MNQMNSKLMLIPTLAGCCLIALNSLGSEKLIVASGSFVITYLKPMVEGIKKEKDITIEHLRDEGMGGDAVLLSVDQRKAEVGLVGFEKEGMAKLIKDKNLTVKNAEKIVFQPLGKDIVNVVTFVGGPKELSRAQVKGIFTGKIVNWKEAGGPDVPAVIYFQANSALTQTLIIEKILDGEDFFRKGSKTVPTAKELVETVAKTKGAISFSSYSGAASIANVPKQEPFIRPIVGITVGPPSPSAKEVFDYFMAHIAK